MGERAVQVSVDISKEKTQYFEKIALASAGTIALVVSFVGSHAGRLQPPWLLRSALIVLVLAMITAMYRNLGSERETVTPPDGMGVFDFEGIWIHSAG
jgi:hypothetical protein